MAIESIQGTSPFVKTESIGTKQTATPDEAQQNFADFLKQSIDQVSKAEGESASLTGKMIRGENVDLHQVLIASQKSSVTLQLTMEVRNKAIEAYQEIMRMQM
ncbi:flagellar hook-basal body complex protein FliE [Bacillus thermotolerans]|uniref:Flagellar hook-basal body complex protein FliE n=1 Tax=Bacillus thermotolerans TaxID=1221996 RepID=A0A0F5I126_BACTR|nr:flagellar hook-basal body complex protein FliE [Bacillus thermotolerans]KKB38980.1 Flagellar hook-basal body complex protein FliE [Bacillus thermotolerans]KKB42354.1 Flagellar hook-basal body complex protein FliE [Bacillus thermotolerans]KKB44663.1 Flagellar hook-basal body complex protein FliE [Bacillus thermotolerans]